MPFPSLREYALDVRDMVLMAASEGSCKTEFMHGADPVIPSDNTDNVQFAVIREIRNLGFVATHQRKRTINSALIVQGMG